MVKRESYLKHDNVRMPEWSKGAVCKTVFRRFKSDSSLNKKAPIPIVNGIGASLLSEV